MRRFTPAGVIAAVLSVAVAHADIVYTLPPQPISATAEFPPSNPGSNHTFAPLDIDNDGVPEFTIHAIYERAFGFPRRGTYLQVERPSVAARWAEGEGFLPLDAGTLISTSDFFLSNDLTFFLEVGLSAQGAWEAGAPPAFFGFQFDINGRAHFGWARAQIDFVVEPVLAWSVTVCDYAYESQPGVGIVTGAVPAPGPAALFGLTLLAASRRRRP